MTCIISGRGVDGVVLVADRKVRYGNGNVASREKIFKDYHPFVIASSGDTMSFDNFMKKALELAQKSRGKFDAQQNFNPVPFDPQNTSGISQGYSNPTSYAIIRNNQYLEGLKKIVQEMKADIKQNKDRYEFDVLIASQTADSGAHISHIDVNGVLREIYDSYWIIGSDSAQYYGAMFVKPLSKRTDVRINEFGETAYFTIKYIDRFGIDDSVGLEGEKPLVYMIPNDGPVERAPKALLDEWESNTNKLLEKFEKYSIRGLL